MTLYSIHIICKSCGKVISKSEPIPIEDLQEYIGSIITPDIVKVMDVFSNEYVIINN